MDNVDKDFLLKQPRLRSFNVLDFDNVYAQKEHTTNAHELLYILDGKITLHMAHNLKFQAMPGDLLLIPSGVPHRDEFAKLKGLRIQITQFEWNADEFFKLVNNRNLINLSYEARTECRRRLEFMRAHWHNTPEDKLNGSIQLHAILTMLYFDLLQQNEVAKNAGEVPIQEAMRRAEHFINQNFMEQISLKETAAYIGISPAYLSRIFHREHGISFTKYLTARRLETAKELLQTTRLQTAEVAARCGFTTSSYFIKVFREHYGVTPRNYAGEKGRSNIMR